MARTRTSSVIWRLPKGNGPHPVVMNIHGGFWRNEYDLTHAGHLCAALTAKGVATWNLEYRRVGRRLARNLVLLVRHMDL
jgi:acetyl esterase/lipase